MIIVGLTGGIGSGKTTVAKMFEELGVPVYNSDKQAKKLMRSSKKLKKKIKELFGKKAYKDGELNRGYIASQVFQDKELLDKLNAIVHPAVRKHFSKWAKKQESPYVIQETAIIFENSMHESYDRIVLVTAPEDIRLKRIIERDNITKMEILARMQNQWDDVDKMPLSNYVIENIELDVTQQKVNEIHRLLLNYSGH